MTTAALVKENIYLELAYRFRGSVRYCHGGTHGGTHGGMQADMVLLEEELRVLRLDVQPAGDCMLHLYAQLRRVRPQGPTSVVTHFLHQAHAL